ncbi:Retrovirus-related Pol polyprotein, partial [Mucuna pruriens]
MFSEKFFLASRIATIRKEICGIRKLTSERLHEYWERFNKLCATCPHHQISEKLLIQYFYEGLIMMDKSMIDAASGGALMDKILATTRYLIPNMASNTQQFGTRGVVASRAVNETQRQYSNQRFGSTQNTPQNQNRYQPLVPKYQAPPFRQQPQQPQQLEGEINFPLLEAIKQILKYAKLVKDLCTYKRKKLKGGVEMGRSVSALIKKKQVSALTQLVMPKKCRDHSTFIVPCTIGDCTFVDAVLDLGASINVMPSLVYKSLNFGDLEPAGVIIQLANKSIAHPLSIQEDVLLRINELIFPADFYVLDMKDEPSSKGSTLILGRSFFMTARTKIDVHVGTLSMKFSDNMVQFNIFEAMKHPTENHSIFGIDVMELLVDDYIQLDISLSKFFDFVNVADVPDFFDFVADVFDFADLVNFECMCERGKECSIQPSPHPDNRVHTRTIESAPGIRICSRQSSPHSASKPPPPPLPSEKLKPLLEHLKGWQATCIFILHRQINTRPPSLARSAHLPTLGCCLAYATPQAPSKESFMEVFMDDFKMYDHSFDACLESLSRVLDRCIETNLVLNFEKCHFMVIEGIVLGHLVSNIGIEVDKAKIDIIASLSHPASVLEVRSFLGHPCIEAFQELKKRLTTIPILQAPNWELPFELMCDASNLALGVVLGQRVGKHSHVIAYASRTLDLAQANYTTIEKELLAIVFALDKFCSYLLGSKIVIFSNHANLKFLLKKHDAKLRLIR